MAWTCDGHGRERRRSRPDAASNKWRDDLFFRLRVHGYDDARLSAMGPLLCRATGRSQVVSQFPQ